jgi:hypothetical protein
MRIRHHRFAAPRAIAAAVALHSLAWGPSPRAAETCDTGSSRTTRSAAGAEASTQAKAPKAKRASSPVPPPASGAAGMRVILDPRTGERLARPSRGTAGAAPTPAPAARPAPAPLVIHRRADGTTLVELDERFMHYTVVRLDPAGRRRTGCVAGEAAARRSLETRAPSAPSAVEE